eukprot:TRINITY_DN1764_c0_g1_i3.p2 TRINITY_DN1764_c0_g1~~TRINITY_DN1764_c0_g1_i3.p2  ORF type:complete len:182 (-),score=82.34 TRINITY_DN1764_c0_g1_i3:238-759(-)
MGIPTQSIMSISTTTCMLVTIFSSVLSLSTPQQEPYQSTTNEEYSLTNVSTCPGCLLVKSSTTIQNKFPWLFNNQQTKFFYSKTDSRGWPIYQYISGQNSVFYIHFYDEGLFYDGFYVINDLETEYVEEEGRVFIYNSDSDDCPDDTGRNWYFWDNGDWEWDESINLQDCNME